MFGSWPIRVTVAIGAVSLAVAGLWVGWSDVGPSFLIEIGAAALLLVPLWIVERSIEARIDKVEQRLEMLDADRISGEVMERMIASRKPDIELFEKVRSEPTQDGVSNALDRAHSLELISSRGIRVSLDETDVHLRFVVPNRRDPVTLEIRAETIEGALLKTFEWDRETATASLGVKVAEWLQEQGSYPGDLLFQFGRVFHELADVLKLGYERKTGFMGFAEPLRGAIIQYFPPQWAITDYGVECVESLRSYPIARERFEEQDWDPHVTSKRWTDIVSFRQAFETAQAFKANDLL